MFNEPMKAIVFKYYLAIKIQLLNFKLFIYSYAVTKQVFLNLSPSFAWPTYHIMSEQINKMFSPIVLIDEYKSRKNMQSPWHLCRFIYNLLNSVGSSQPRGQVRLSSHLFNLTSVSFWLHNRTIDQIKHEKHVWLILNYFIPDILK